MSCIYGPRQFGTEDQGWVAHFLIQARKRLPVTIFGDGRQVRDILAIQDLVRAFLVAEKNIDSIKGDAFNIGGGPKNTLSLLELLNDIAETDGLRPQVQYLGSRLGDQKYYVSDFTKFSSATGWQPTLSVYQGLARLRAWLDTSESAVENSARLSPVVGV
jgi:CDP-paratose 2-epimerase